MVEDELKRARELVVFIHTVVNHPSTSGAVWTKYPADKAQQVINATWELGLLLGCAPGQRDETT